MPISKDPWEQRLRKADDNYAMEVVNNMTSKNKETLLLLYVHMKEAITAIAKVPEDLKGLVELADNFTCWVNPKYGKVGGRNQGRGLYIDGDGKTKKLKKSNQKRKIK